MKSALEGVYHEMHAASITELKAESGECYNDNMALERHSTKMEISS
jgi:hypothetical protein